MTKNLGILQPKIAETDYIAGAETGIIYDGEIKPSGDWTKQLPIKETQFPGWETSACVTFSATNDVETQLNNMMNAGLIPVDKLQLLKTWGYVENDKFNFSDRFTAKMSGTTPQGNTLQKVWDSIRKDGLVPEAMWPFKGTVNWADGYKDIPQQIRDFGKNILTIFDFKYEWVVTGNCGIPNLEYLKYHLRQAPLQVAHPLCGREDNGNMKMCPSGVCVTQHATLIYNINDFIEDFDHYDASFYNKYPLTYPLPYIMKAVVLLKQPQTENPPFNHVFLVDMHYWEKTDEIVWLQKGLNLLGYNIPTTGFFGNITKAAVKDFQVKYKVANALVLAWNGGKYAGPATRKKLNELLK